MNLALCVTILLVATLSQSGCQSTPTQISYEGLNKEIHHSEEANWHYAGTQNGFHFLIQRLPVESLFPIPESKYIHVFKIATNELPLDVSFPLTEDRSAWKPVFRKETGLVKGRDFPWIVSIDYMPGLRDVQQTNSTPKD